MYAFVNYPGSFFINVSEITRQLRQFLQALVAAERVFILLAQQGLYHRMYLLQQGNGG